MVSFLPPQARYPSQRCLKRSLFAHDNRAQMTMNPPSEQMALKLIRSPSPKQRVPVAPQNGPWSNKKLSMPLNHKRENLILLFKFLLDSGPFCGATGTLCFRLWMTLPMGFKARLDSSLLELFCHLRTMIPRATSGYQDWESNPDHSPVRGAWYHCTSPAHNQVHSCVCNSLKKRKKKKKKTESNSTVLD